MQVSSNMSGIYRPVALAIGPGTSVQIVAFIGKSWLFWAFGLLCFWPSSRRHMGWRFHIVWTATWFTNIRTPSGLYDKLISL
jgi:hypothetical protein